MGYSSYRATNQGFTNPRKELYGRPVLTKEPVVFLIMQNIRLAICKLSASPINWHIRMTTDQEFFDVLMATLAVQRVTVGDLHSVFLLKWVVNLLKTINCLKCSRMKNKREDAETGAILTNFKHYLGRYCRCQHRFSPQLIIRHGIIRSKGLAFKQQLWSGDKTLHQSC